MSAQGVRHTSQDVRHSKDYRLWSQHGGMPLRLSVRQVKTHYIKGGGDKKFERRFVEAPHHADIPPKTIPLPMMDAIPQCVTARDTHMMQEPPVIHISLTLPLTPPSFSNSNSNSCAKPCPSLSHSVPAQRPPTPALSNSNSNSEKSDLGHHPRIRTPPFAAHTTIPAPVAAHQHIDFKAPPPNPPSFRALGVFVFPPPQCPYAVPGLRLPTIPLGLAPMLFFLGEYCPKQNLAEALMIKKTCIPPDSVLSSGCPCCKSHWGVQSNLIQYNAGEVTGEGKPAPPLFVHLHDTYMPFHYRVLYCWRCRELGNELPRIPIPKILHVQKPPPEHGILPERPYIPAQPEAKCDAKPPPPQSQHSLQLVHSPSLSDDCDDFDRIAQDIDAARISLFG